MRRGALNKSKQLCPYGKPEGNYAFSQHD
jgi:ribosome modulation factor